MSLDELDTTDSGPLPLYQDTTQLGLARLERKVDKITSILSKFILVEERQSNQRAELDELAKDVKAITVRIERIERKVDKWVNFGVGGWAVITCAWAIYTLIARS